VNMDVYVERLGLFGIYNIRRLFLLMFTRYVAPLLIASQSRNSSTSLVHASPVKSYGGGARVVFCQGLDLRSSEVRSCGVAKQRSDVEPSDWSIERSSAVGGRYPPEYYIKYWLRII
jgi:hypothetical protein